MSQSLTLVTSALMCVCAGTCVHEHWCMGAYVRARVCLYGLCMCSAGRGSCLRLLEQDNAIPQRSILLQRERPPEKRTRVSSPWPCAHTKPVKICKAPLHVKTYAHTSEHARRRPGPPCAGFTGLALMHAPMHAGMCVRACTCFALLCF